MRAVSFEGVPTMERLLNIRMDEELKKQFDAFCSTVGMNMTTAINVFAKTVVRQQKIPFEITAIDDPFYSEKHLARLRKSIAQINEGKAVVKTMSELEAMESE